MENDESTVVTNATGKAAYRHAEGPIIKCPRPQDFDERRDLDMCAKSVSSMSLSDNGERWYENPPRMSRLQRKCLVDKERYSTSDDGQDDTDGETAMTKEEEKAFKKEQDILRNRRLKSLRNMMGFSTSRFSSSTKDYATDADKTAQIANLSGKGSKNSKTRRASKT